MLSLLNATCLKGGFVVSLIQLAPLDVQAQTWAPKEEVNDKVRVGSERDFCPRVEKMLMVSPARIQKVRICNTSVLLYCRMFPVHCYR